MQNFEIIVVSVFLLAMMTVTVAFVTVVTSRAKRARRDGVDPREVLSRFAVRFLEWVDESKRKNALAKEKRNEKREEMIRKKTYKSSSGGRLGNYSYSSCTKKARKHSGKCDGNCASCPPHYGYRHGRWYYGHSHVEGCEFGGNKGDGGRD